MVKVVYFITPTSFVKIGTKLIEFIPVIGPTLEFSKKARKVTELGDPVSASSRGIGMIFGYCFGKTGALSIECALWLSLSVTGGITGNPGLIAVGTQFGTMVVDEIID